MACTTKTLTHSTMGKCPASLCVSQTTSDVNVSLTVTDSVMSFDAKFSWEMELQRYDGSKWNVVGHRTGSVSQDSPSHRTFSDVAKKNAQMKVVAYIYDSSLSTAAAQVMSVKFTR